MAEDLGAQLIADLKGRFADLGRRLTESLDRMEEEDLGWRPDPASNSVGNLVLHLCGSLRQRFEAGFGGGQFVRNREAEFQAEGPFRRDELKAEVAARFGALDGFLAGLEPARLQERRALPSGETTLLDALMMAYGHTAEHVGQIIYVAKARRGAAFGTLWGTPVRRP